MKLVVDILRIPDPNARREKLASWALGVLESVPAFRHGAGRTLTEVERVTIMDDVVVEILKQADDGSLPVLEKIVGDVADDDAEAALRFALWHRAQQLVAQQCAARDPLWVKWRRRITYFFQQQGVELRLVRFGFCGAVFFARETWNSKGRSRIPDREDLERIIAEDSGSKKDLAALLSYIFDALEETDELKPWIGVDDLAFVLARREERFIAQEQVESYWPVGLELSEVELRSLFDKATQSMQKWFDEEYIPRKGYDTEIGNGLWRALCDHISILAENRDHPGNSALVRYHLPQVAPAEFHKSKYRSDFQWMCKRFGEELMNNYREFSGG